MNDRDKIIDKIKKCLALSASSNEHEAAAALRQATKLMAAHGITDLDMQSAEVSEARTRAGAMMYPAAWETALAGTIADAFACRMLFTCNRPKKCGEWVFIGMGASQEVAEYAFRVLFRQAKAARSEYIKSRLKRCYPGNKTHRANIYCHGWVKTVTALIDVFTGVETNHPSINAYIDRKYPSLRTKAPRGRNADRKLRADEEMDYIYGRLSGRDAKLDRGVGSASTPLALE